MTKKKKLTKNNRPISATNQSKKNKMMLAACEDANTDILNLQRHLGQFVNIVQTARFTLAQLSREGNDTHSELLAKLDEINDVVQNTVGGCLATIRALGIQISKPMSEVTYLARTGYLMEIGQNLDLIRSTLIPFEPVVKDALLLMQKMHDEKIAAAQAEAEAAPEVSVEQAADTVISAEPQTESLVQEMKLTSVGETSAPANDCDCAEPCEVCTCVDTPLQAEEPAVQTFPTA